MGELAVFIKNQLNAHKACEQKGSKQAAGGKGFV
jgi:hypothetical protein